MNPPTLPRLSLLTGEYVILRLAANSASQRGLFKWLEDDRPAPVSGETRTRSRECQSSRWQSVTWTDDEISVVLASDEAQNLIDCLKGDTAEFRISPERRILKVHGPLPLEWVGILAGLTKVLADVEVSLFCVATFDTDYLLVECTQIQLAQAALRRAGYRID